MSYGAHCVHGHNDGEGQNDLSQLLFAWPLLGYLKERLMIP